MTSALPVSWGDIEYLVEGRLMERGVGHLNSHSRDEIQLRKLPLHVCILSSISNVGASVQDSKSNPVELKLKFSRFGSEVIEGEDASMLSRARGRVSLFWDTTRDEVGPHPGGRDRR
ncbi:hypothetical protein EVAR_33859_1 [Eumeta japonica]|uniref:Uncharacterized protein n=1 Tax=Eumeta variegata TaxID=151549 RepID=A0A4C1X827_EUMVA|nr:hypothetical protein EVAR_33859_1 [Eumeta japonica]